MALEVGQVIDQKYKVTRLIGRGGMGDVFEGENARIRRRVAIKVLHAASAAQPELVTRFEREAQAAGCIGSDHILEILDLGVLPNGDRYMVMEYLDGEPLAKRLERVGPMHPAHAFPVILQVLEGLQAAHAAGIIHRDLKPDNVFILREKAGRKDFVKIIDFGISKFTRAGDTLNVTRAGAMMGTPLYMSPEQARGSSEADARSDIYAVGVILHEMLSGRTPFRAQTFNELLFEIVLAELPKLETFVPDVDPEVAAIVKRAMEREPAKRFQSCADMIAAMEACLPRLQAKAPPPGAARPRAATMQDVALPPGFGAAAEPARPLPAAGTPAMPTPTPNPANPTPNPPLLGPADLITANPTPAHATPHPNVATQDSWSQSQAGAAPAKKSPAPMIAAIAVAGVLVLGGAGFAISKIVGGGDEKATSGEEAKKASAKGLEKKDDKKSEGKDPDEKKADEKKADEKKADEKQGEDPKPPPKETAAPTATPAAPTNTGVAIKPTATAPGTSTAAPIGTGTAKKPAASGKPAATGPGASGPDFGY